jgi:CrcB protein
MKIWILIFLGAGIGGALRHGMNGGITRLMGYGFPYGILTINVLGSLSMGLAIGWLAFRGEASYSLRLFLATGVLGGFTTFSAFSLDAALLYERGQPWLAVMYVLASVGLSIGALFAGLWSMRTLVG